VRRAAGLRRGGAGQARRGAAGKRSGGGRRQGSGWRRGVPAGGGGPARTADGGSGASAPGGAGGCGRGGCSGGGGAGRGHPGRHGGAPSRSRRVSVAPWARRADPTDADPTNAAARRRSWCGSATWCASRRRSWWSCGRRHARANIRTSPASGNACLKVAQRMSCRAVSTRPGGAGSAQVQAQCQERADMQRALDEALSSAKGSSAAPGGRGRGAGAGAGGPPSPAAAAAASTTPAANWPQSARGAGRGPTTGRRGGHFV